MLQHTCPSTCCHDGVGRSGCFREESGNHRRPVSGVATLNSTFTMHISVICCLAP
ncbi:uncharacterized protein BJX67DRAFT_352560 [Aspergillus lucknowensis]|uniref:Uncharacterized protein n=1 Tax=Aspergillus lucknowensis TaxID=176173 RepID=A0ABR4LSL7_9EURO